MHYLQFTAPALKKKPFMTTALQLVAMITAFVYLWQIALIPTDCYVGCYG